MTSRPWQFQWMTKANLHMSLLTLSAWFMRFVPTAIRPSDMARGFVWDPLIPGRDLSSMPSRYLIDWGVSQKRTLNPDEGRCPTLCLTTTDFRKLTTYRRLYSDFD